MEKLTQQTEFKKGLTHFGRNIIAALTTDLDFRAAVAVENYDRIQEQAANPRIYFLKSKKIERMADKAYKLESKAAKKHGMDYRTYTTNEVYKQNRIDMIFNNK